MHTQIKILPLLLLLITFCSCRQAGEENPALQAGLYSQSQSSGAQKEENTWMSIERLNLQSNTACCQHVDTDVSAAQNIIFKSVDGGKTWQDVSAGLPKDLRAGSIIIDHEAVLLSHENGLYRSSNTKLANLNWTPEAFPVKNISDLFPGRNGAYAYSYGNGFFQLVPGSGIWIPIAKTLKDNLVLTILEIPDGTIFIGGYGGIFKSTDGGKTWKPVFEQGLVSTLVATDGVLVAGGEKGVLQSTDSGEHWNWIQKEAGQPIKMEAVQGGLAAIFIHGPGKEVNTNGMRNNLLTSSDHGKTWNRIDKGLPEVRSMLDVKQAGEYLFCSLDTGIYRSANQGQTWELVFPSTSMKVFNLAVSGQVIYAVKVFEGC